MSIPRGNWTECTATITGKGTARIMFIHDKRFFLDEVLIKSTDTTDIHAVELLQKDNKKSKIYSIHGHLGTDLTTLPKGIYIVNGKKMVK